VLLNYLMVRSWKITLRIIPPLKSYTGKLPPLVMDLSGL
jgi:hypothetical protein